MTYWSYWSLPGLAVGGGAGRREGASRERVRRRKYLKITSYKQ